MKSIDVIQEISRELYYLIPENKYSIEMIGLICENKIRQIYYILNSKKEKGKLFSENHIPYSKNDLFFELIKKLKKTKDFIEKKGDFNHFSFLVTKDLDIDVNFRYIPQENSYPDVLMKGVSELTEEEATREFFIEKKEWERLMKRYPLIIKKYF